MWSDSSLTTMWYLFLHLQLFVHNYCCPFLLHWASNPIFHPRYWLSALSFLGQGQNVSLKLCCVLQLALIRIELNRNPVYQCINWSISSLEGLIIKLFRKFLFSYFLAFQELLNLSFHIKIKSYTSQEAHKMAP